MKLAEELNTFQINKKETGLFGSRKHATKDHLEWFSRPYIRDCQHQCGDTLFPDKDRELVVFPNEQWKDDCCLMQARHNSDYSTPIEVKLNNIEIMFIIANINDCLDSHVENGCAAFRCCYFGSHDTDSSDQLKAHRDTCLDLKAKKKISDFCIN